MKTKIKRHSRSVISVILAVCMLVSCMTVGMIATDAARVDSESTGKWTTQTSFESGSTVYLDLNETTGWSDNARIVALFYYSDNLDWNYENASGNYSSSTGYHDDSQYYEIKGGDSGYSTLGSWTDTSKVTDTVYSVTVPAGNLGGMRFVRIAPDSGRVYNVSTFMQAAEQGTKTGVQLTGWDSSKWEDFTVKTTYYLHTSSNDSGMAGTTGQEMTDNGNGTYSFTVSTWDSDKLNFNITKSSTAAKDTTELDSVTITTSDGVSVSQTLTAWDGYKRVEVALSSKPQNVTFTFNPTAKTLSVAGSEVKVQLTAGGSTSDYTLRISDGSTVITNSGTKTAQFLKGKTVTVTVTPKDEAKKVTAITNCNSVTNNGDGTYTGTFTVDQAATITANLETRNKYDVTFSSNNNEYGTVSAKANGTALASGTQVYEGTKVTFTATPKNGYALQKWSDNSTAKTVTKAIMAATTMNATFIKEGYSVNYGQEDNIAMKMLPNGWYINSLETTGNAWFVIKRDSDNKFSTTGATVNASKTNAKITNWGNNKIFNDGSVLKKDENNPAKGYITFDPETGYVWLSDNTDGYQPITVIAKNGTIRTQDNKTHTADFGVTTVEDLSETKIDSSKIEANAYKKKDTDAKGQAVIYNLTGSDISKGVTLKIKTQVNPAQVADGYYVKGFAVSGHEETYSVLWQEFDKDGKPLANDWIDRGYNEFTLTIDSYSGDPIEITPIYSLKESESGDNVRFYIEGFAGDVKNEWGGTIAVDVYGENSYRPFGEYPGQPMINYNGRYMMDIPRKNIQGITMNNYIWDRVHADYFYGTIGKNDGQMADIIRSKNHQTYDYNDFVYINKKLTSLDLDEDIIFSFRYKKDENHNEKSSSNLSDKAWYKDNENYTTSGTYADGTVNANDYRNGYTTIDENNSMYQFENLTDFYGQRVDVLGDLVDVDGNTTKAGYNPVLIVSNGYDFNKAGDYATAWAIYYPEHETGDPGTYTLIDVIGGAGRSTQDWQSQSMLVDPDSEARIRFKYDASVQGDASWQQKYQDQNNGSENYPSLIKDLAKYPVKITYEYEVGADKSNYGGSQVNYGYRSDGRWYFSNSNQKVTAHTLIEVAEKQGGVYTRDYYQENNIDYTSETGYVATAHTGINTRIQAYLENDGYENRKGISFTNTAGNTEAYAITDGEDTFDLFTQGDSDGNYTFEGWYLYQNGNYTLVSRSERYAAEATNNDVFVARYYRTPSGTLTVSHSLHPDSEGKAACYAKVEVMSGSTVKFTYPETTDSIKVTNTYMKSGSTNTLKITLRTVPDNSSFEKFYKNLSGTIEPLAAAGVLDTVSNITTDSEGVASVTITTKQIQNFFNADGEQTVKALPFFSKLDEATKSFTITKTLAEYTETQSFVVSIEKSTDGTTWEPFANMPYTSSKDPSTTKYTGYTPGNANICQNETLTFSNIPANMYIKITETGTFKDYIFDSATAKLHSNSATDAANVSEDKASKSIVFQLTDDDVDVTINNKRQEYRWIIKFTYDSRLWDEQGYQAEGTFTKAQLDEYTVYGEVEDSSTGNKVQGIKFKDATARAQFVQKYVPHEDNYRKTVVWDFGNFTENFHFANKQISMGQKAQPGKEELLTVKFSFPCEMEHTSENGSKAKYVDENGHAIVDSSSATALRLDNVSYMNWYCLNDAKIVNGVANKEPIFVSAPESILDKTDNNKVKYFQYWSVKTMNDDPEKCVEYTRCYNREFNYAFYQNSIVTPVYVEADGPFNHNKMAQDARSDNPASITFLETSRNIWNNKECGTAQKVWNNEGKYSDYGDRIFVDFVLDLHYIENGKNIQLNTIPAANQGNYHAGLLIEQLNELDKDSSGNYICDIDHYTSQVEYSNNDGKTNALLALTSGNATKANKYYNSPISVSKFDNKNELEYYYHFANISQSAEYRTRTNYKNYLYRAYTYLYVGNGATTKIISAPVYFTMYEMASIENDYEKSFD